MFAVLCELYLECSRLEPGFAPKLNLLLTESRTPMADTLQAGSYTRHG